ncbi:MAG: DUF1864 family protein [Pseudomonadales bacterium]|nr:DUF1864 family protein [Pseudomonadales bacterium]
MSNNTVAFDQWIRARFVDINSALEKRYQQQEDKANVLGIGSEEKKALRSEGENCIRALVAEGNTDEGFDSAFNLLGNVGLFMAACRRHEITEPSREKHSPLVEASGLAMQIGASIGVTPRFATAHLTTHNSAVNGVYKRFTNLSCEKIFVDYNTKGILAYKRAADALLKILPLGISHPIAGDLLAVTKLSLEAVADSNKELFEQLDPDDFFYHVRPYYKPYYVGSHVYRGANAGDFAGINVVDLLLGLCFANEPYYAQILVDKFLYMMPEDQDMLRDCMRRSSLMDDFISNIPNANQSWFQTNLRLFLEVCASHGATANQHQEMLVQKYIVAPSQTLASQHLKSITASGPPLDELIDGLKKLRDHRTATKRDDVRTRFDDINKLKSTLIE